MVYPSGKTLLLLFALLWVWLMIVATTAGLTPRRAAVQVVVIVTMVAALVTGISIPGAFEDRGLAFAGAYVLIQVRRAILLGVVLRRHPLRRGRPAWFENVVFGRVSWSRWVGIVVLAAIATPMTRAPPLAAAACAAAVLLGIAVSDSLRARRQPGEEPAPPI